MLDHEQKVHEILDSSMQHHQNGSAVSVPTFLPPKVTVFSFLLMLISLTKRFRNLIMNYSASCSQEFINFIAICTLCMNFMVQRL